MYRFFFLSPQNIPYFSSRLMLPLPASIAKDKENGTNNPVHRHATQTPKTPNPIRTPST